MIVNMNEWIPVNKKMPPCGERILVTLAGQVWEARYSGGGRWHRYNSYDLEWWMDGRVTAWMPLPAGFGQTNA